MRKFESLVLPILFYNCEIWGPLICKTKMEQIEIFYRKNLRRILKIHSNSPVSVIYCELGCYPIIDRIRYKVLQYIVKVQTEPSKWMCNVAFKELKRINHPYWTFISNHCSVDPAVIEKKNIYKFLKEGYNRIFFDSKNKILDDVRNNVKNNFYNFIHSGDEEVFGFKNYLDFLEPNKRPFVTRLRCGAHRLNIEIGRWAQLPRNQRLCRFCSERKIEDESHILLECPAFGDLRDKMQQDCDQVGIQIFMNSDDCLVHVATFLRSLSHRVKKEHNKCLF